MTKLMTLLLLIFTLMASGCTSVHSYMAPTEAERARWQEDDEARKKKEAEGPLGGPWGKVLYLAGVIGSAFK